MSNRIFTHPSTGESSITLTEAEAKLIGEGKNVSEGVVVTVREYTHTKRAVKEVWYNGKQIYGHMVLE